MLLPGPPSQSALPAVGVMRAPLEQILGGGGDREGKVRTVSLGRGLSEFRDKELRNGVVTGEECGINGGVLKRRKVS